MMTRGGTGADARRARERRRGQFGLGDPGKYRGVTVVPMRCFLWSVVPAGMDAGREEAVGLANNSPAHRILAIIDEPQRFVQHSRCSSLHLG